MENRRDTFRTSFKVRELAPAFGAAKLAPRRPATLTARAGVTPTRLTQFVKRIFGDTPRPLITRIRALRIVMGIAYFG